MHLNALAEDLRVLAEVPGLTSVLHDLKQVKGYGPTRHVVRMAAMMGRAGSRILQLFEPSNVSIPDFEIEVAGRLVTVEAKQLTESGPSRQFNAYANELMHRVLEGVFTSPENYPVVHVVVKDPHSLPSQDAVMDSIRDALVSYDGAPSVRRSMDFNIFIDPVPASVSRSFADHRCLQIVCPRSSKENLRIARSAEKSNKQLRNHTKDQRPGLLCLGLTEHQDVHLVAQVLRRKFMGGQLRGISGVILHASGQHEGPDPRVIIDLVSPVDNPNALVAPPSNIPIQSLGMVFDLFGQTPSTDAVSTYRVGTVRGTIKRVEEAFLGLNMVRRLTPEMLQ